MVGFITNSGTKYYINEVDKTIWGGRIKSPKRYVDCSVMIGCNGIFILEDGKVLKTNIIRGYL